MAHRTLALLVSCLLSAASALVLVGASSVLLLSATVAQGQQVPSGAVRVYVGTYTSGESKGIYRLRLDLASGALSPEGEPTAAINPSFLSFAPSRKYLYAVNETGESRSSAPGGVSAFAVDPHSGELQLLNQQSCAGAAPCYVSVDRDGKNLLVANYFGGNAAVLPIAADDSLGEPRSVLGGEGKGPAPQQDGPHAHSINLDAAGRFGVLADLGLDQLLLYRFDAASGQLAPNSPASVSLPPGSGPRHFAFQPDGHHAYAVNELTSSVAVFDYDAADGALAQRQIASALPADFKGTSFAAEVVVHPEGKWVYTSNRGHDSIAIFAISPESGELRLVGNEPTRGKFPRGFAIDPSGAYLLVANQNSDNLAVFRIERASSALTGVGEPVHVPRPTAVRMVAIGG